MPRIFGKKNLMRRNNVKLTCSLTLGFLEILFQIDGAT